MEHTDINPMGEVPGGRVIPQESTLSMRFGSVVGEQLWEGLSVACAHAWMCW